MEIDAFEYEPVLEEDSQDDNIYETVSDLPEFLGNGLRLEEFLNKNLQYPWTASVQNIEGVVFLEFVVETDGSISNIVVISGLGFGCDEEAVRLIKLTDGMWEPGSDNGQAVRVLMTVPVRFNL